MEKNILKKDNGFIRVCKKIFAFYKRHEYIFFGVAFLAIALYLRFCWLDFESGDYRGCLSKWFKEIKEMGGLKGFSSTTGDYMPMYKYIITILTYIPVKDLYLYKYVSCMFDVAMAVFVALTVYHVTRNKLRTLLAYAATLFLPTVFLNSAVWAQCDSIFTFFCVLSLYFLLKNHGRCSMIFYGIAFSFKLQAVFFAPFVVIAFLKKRLKFTDLLFFPIAYVACALPAILAGMSFFDALFGAYSKQVGEYDKLTLNAPNLYQILSDSYMKNENLAKMCVAMAIGICCMFGAYFYMKKYEMGDKEAITVAYVFAVVVPYVLPHMHERYFYLADIFALIFAFVYPKKGYIPLITMYGSFRAITKFLFDSSATKINFVHVAVLTGVGIVLLCKFVIEEFDRKSSADNADTAVAKTSVAETENESQAKSSEVKAEETAK